MERPGWAKRFNIHPKGYGTKYKNKPWPHFQRDECWISIRTKNTFKKNKIYVLLFYFFGIYFLDKVIASHDLETIVLDVDRKVSVLGQLMHSERRL